MKSKNIEVEGNEFLLESNEGHYAVIPAKDRNAVMAMIGCDDCINSYIKNLPKESDYAEDGTLVSELYKQKTGKDWSTAKKEGLTTGSFDDNLKLRERLLKGEFDNKTENVSNLAIKNTETTTQDYAKAKNFNEAFSIARKQLGANQIFEYQGRKYGTNLQGEKFEPSEKVLTEANMNKPEIKERLQNQNKLTESVYSTKKTTKIEPEYQDWDKIKQRKNEINKMSQADIIKEYHKDSKDQYLVLDKKRGIMHLYEGNKEVSSFNVGTGSNVGDEQTKTVVKDGKVLWDEGNKMTGAGIYEVSGVNPKNKQYSNAPSWNFKNEQGIEVPMAMHGALSGRLGKIQDSDETNNRLSNGCINGVCYDLETLYKKGYSQGKKLYVLPDDENNTYEISNGKLIFKSKDPNVNKTIKTLNYKPIKIEYPKEYREEIPKMASAAVNNKKNLMVDLKINGDVYNDITSLALGVAGQESDYGESFKYMLKNETTQDLAKYIAGNKSYNSKGLTQIKYDGVIQNKEVKQLFDKYGINKNNLDSGDKAILAQIILFATAYKYELPNYKDVKIDDMEKLLYLNQGKASELKNKTATPEKNTYIKNVKDYSKMFKIKELN
jgi:hypothetical protein